MTKGLHHSAYRCRDSEETRRFYEDFLGLPLIEALAIGKADALHTFFQMADGSCLAFFEVPGRPFDFKEQHDFDLHIALEVDGETLDDMFAKGKAAGIETRGIADHGICRSIYFRDPNGYVVELAAPGIKTLGEEPARARQAAQEILRAWRESKALAAAE